MIPRRTAAILQLCDHKHEDECPHTRVEKQKDGKKLGRKERPEWPTLEFLLGETYNLSPSLASTQSHLGFLLLLLETNLTDTGL